MKSKWMRNFSHDRMNAIKQKVSSAYIRVQCNKLKMLIINLNKVCIQSDVLLIEISVI